MNQRERMLLIVVVVLGAVGILLGGYMGIATISGWFESGSDRIASLEKQLADKKRIVKDTEAAKRKIADWKTRSLPGQPAKASLMYRAWLLSRVEGVQLGSPQVAAASQRTEKGLFTALSFSVTGTGTLQQIVDLLYDFYSVDHPHRITRLKISPTKEPKQFLLTMTVEALSMEGAADADQLPERPGTRLEMPTREDYLTAILERNLFGGPNQPPQLSGAGQQRGTVGTPVEVTLSVSDRDQVDKHTFKLESSGGTRGADLDSSSGRFTWTPRRTGTFEFLVAVTDDGIPPKTTSEKLIVTVDEPPVVAAEPMPLAFDEAKYTVLAAVIHKSGIGEVWLHVRPREQKGMLKLGVGDSFEVGSVKGTVKSIDDAFFVFESDGKLLKLGTREVLTSAEEAEEPAANDP